MHQTYPVHPLAEAFPLIEGPAFDELVSSIRDNGLREPVVLYQGAVLDGRNRLRACEAAGVYPRFDEYAGDNPAAYVIDKNINRRHLNESQRAMVAAKLANIPHGVHKNAEAQIGTSSISVSDAAARLNVGERTVQKARSILAADDTESVVRQIEHGEVAVSTALDRINGVQRDKRRKDNPQTQRQATHQMRGDIWHQFKTALVALTGMPHVEDAVGIIRSQDRNGFVAEKLPLAADYIRDFLDAWNSDNG